MCKISTIQRFVLGTLLIANILAIVHQCAIIGGGHSQQNDAIENEKVVSDQILFTISRFLRLKVGMNL